MSRLIFAPSLQASSAQMTKQAQSGPGFSRVAAGALDLRRGPQGPALVASGKVSAHASCSGSCTVIVGLSFSPLLAGGAFLFVWLGFLFSFFFSLR